MGETRVDLLHLLEDLRDAYPGSIEETILTEIIANSLDSGAMTITMTADPTTSAFTRTRGDARERLCRKDLRLPPRWRASRPACYRRSVRGHMWLKALALVAVALSGATTAWTVTARADPDSKNPADNAWSAASPKLIIASQRMNLIARPLASMVLVDSSVVIHAPSYLWPVPVVRCMTEWGMGT